ncbi:hypothetical protein OA805_23905 [Citrobacter freundii]|uniref:hypothetical protein n=1 Tax=Citrobacter freundii TaxID=546 RepID=UPI0025CA9734|nr:hypothetical protein [Citrobacter freundii]MDN4295131.1 hypothetical protein [Citrobacter freundii]
MEVKPKWFDIFPSHAFNQNQASLTRGFLFSPGGGVWSKSERLFQMGPNTTAIFVVVHSNQTMHFVQKVLFMPFLNV